MLGLVRALLGEGGQGEGAVLARVDMERALFWGKDGIGKWMLGLMRALRNKNTRHNVKVHLSLSYICGGSHKSLWVLREGKRHRVVKLSTSHRLLSPLSSASRSI